MWHRRIWSSWCFENRQYLKRASLLKKKVISGFLEIKAYLGIHIKLSQENEQVNINDVSFPLEKKHL